MVLCVNQAAVPPVNLQVCAAVHQQRPTAAVRLKQSVQEDGPVTDTVTVTAGVDTGIEFLKLILKT